MQATHRVSRCRLPRHGARSGVELGRPPLARKVRLPSAIVEIVLKLRRFLWMTCHAKRLECVQLAGAVVRRGRLESGSNLHALQTLRAAKAEATPLAKFPGPGGFTACRTKQPAGEPHGFSARIGGRPTGCSHPAGSRGGGNRGQTSVIAQEGAAGQAHRLATRRSRRVDDSEPILPRRAESGSTARKPSRMSDAALSPLAANSGSPATISSSKPATRWWSWVLMPQTRKSPNGGRRRSRTTGRFLI